MINLKMGICSALSSLGVNMKFVFPKAVWLTCASLIAVGTVQDVQAQNWRDAPAYDKALASNVLERSVFFLPLHGAVYPAKFEAMLKEIPNIRGVVIHNHGCGGQWGWETHVAQFYYRQGFAVIAPEFVTRPGNKLGCPGGSPEESLRRGAERFREGIYTARNPARLSARGDDIAQVIKWLQPITQLPIILSGHSEGCRTVYFWDRAEPQVKGGICHKQSLHPLYEHLWKWDTNLPMWSSNEDEDPWAQGSKAQPAIGFERKFTARPENLTSYRHWGNSHDPLVRSDEVGSLRAWLARHVPVSASSSTSSLMYEDKLPSIQERLQARPTLR
jgi:dienelactone hydrolase